MNRKIYKYELQILDDQMVGMPEDPEVLCVKEQDGKLMLWALVDTNRAMSYTKIRILGTGHSFNDRQRYSYIDTVIMRQGAQSGLVWHVFLEVVPPWKETT